MHQSYPSCVEIFSGPGLNYQDVDQRQNQIADLLIQGHLTSGKILLSHFDAVITMGKRSLRSEVWASDEILKSRGVALLKTDRGGLCTYHGPGQWVLFIVETLERLTGDVRGVRKATDMLLDIALNAAHSVNADVVADRTERVGLWLGAQKVGSVGVQIKNGVLLHGLSLNGFKTEQSFFGLNKPCGLDIEPGFLLDASAPDLNQKFIDLGKALINWALRLTHFRGELYKDKIFDGA